MIFCSTHCTPSCLWCVYAIHEEWDNDNGEHIVGGPIACKFSDDLRLQNLADNCMYCENFHCELAEDLIDFYCDNCGERIIANKALYPCPHCGHMYYYPYEEWRAQLAHEEWIHTRKWKCCNCGKWHWDISGPDYKCECGSTLFEDKYNEE